jgi:hypothetical protein
MIKITKVGTLISTGEVVFQHDAGSFRIFKTAAGKVVTIAQISFVEGLVTPVNEKSLVEPVTRETPEQDKASGATVAIMEEANKKYSF